ncbi:MAG TPA: aspartate-semialdehyde dehydrogenase [Candidatus Marinimicrobia bacterium]|nr:aspartate-semialdehyde dehydrogenase [Candidatus Neomarinimicrobiota bacterium]
MKKTEVGILGATGMVGQILIMLLGNHPWFEIKALSASPRSAGKRYKDAVHWLQAASIPEAVADLPIYQSGEPLPAQMLFSALDASVAGEIEMLYAQNGSVVISNARNHRMRPDVPLLMPMVNPDHLSVAQKQPYSGKIVTNPNCSTAGLVTALQPLQKNFGLRSVHVVTMQALSGAGYPGLSSLDIADNLIPYISGEEEKIEEETKKILGDFDGKNIESANIEVSAQCNRVNVLDGHTESVLVSFQKEIHREEIIRAWQDYRSKPQILLLPSTPKRPIIWHTEAEYPQPRLHRMVEKGMAVHVGRLRQHDTHTFSFTLLLHNTILGAAGTAIHNAELYISQKGKK